MKSRKTESIGLRSKAQMSCAAELTTSGVNLSYTRIARRYSTIILQHGSSNLCTIRAGHRHGHFNKSYKESLVFPQHKLAKFRSAVTKDIQISVLRCKLCMDIFSQLEGMCSMSIFVILQLEQARLLPITCSRGSIVQENRLYIRNQEDEGREQLLSLTHFALNIEES